MKPTAFLINTSRGQVVDEAALYRALTEGRLAGAGLDVVDKEPVDASNPLVGLENVIVTPHMAANSAEALMDLRRYACDAVIGALAGRWPPSVVNPQVLGRTVPARS
jgi:D-3-phosphoglycerate dehydrogenase / 2-oxoglutarate reductase